MFSVTYSRIELINLGFSVSGTQYKDSKRYENLGFKDFIDKKSRAVNQNNKNLVIEYLLKNSSDFRELNKNNEPIYYLLCPKIEIYKKLIKEKNIKMSLSTFYKLCDKNFKKPVKKTDLCPTCEKGKKIEKKLQNRTSQPDNNLIEDHQLYREHLQLSQHQRKMFNIQKENLTENTEIIIMDFKQNMKIGGSCRETSRDFYNKSDLSVLGFCIIYKQENCIKRKNYNFISENLSHDSFFVKKAIMWLLRNNKLSEFSKLKFWSDCGNHFRSRELIYFILKEICEESLFLEIELNFFAEYHGKNDVDGNFGVLSKWFKDGQNVNKIDNIDDLINFFQRKADDENETLEYEFINFCPGARERNYRKINLQKFQMYLSYRESLGNISYSPATVESSEELYELELSFETTKDVRKTRTSIKRRSENIMGPLAKANTKARYAFINR